MHLSFSRLLPSASRSRRTHLFSRPKSFSTPKLQPASLIYMKNCFPLLHRFAPTEVPGCSSLLPHLPLHVAHSLQQTQTTVSSLSFPMQHLPYYPPRKQWLSTSSPHHLGCLLLYTSRAPPHCFVETSSSMSPLPHVAHDITTFLSTRAATPPRLSPSKVAAGLSLSTLQSEPTTYRFLLQLHLPCFFFPKSHRKSHPYSRPISLLHKAPTNSTVFSPLRYISLMQQHSTRAPPPCSSRTSISLTPLQQLGISSTLAETRSHATYSSTELHLFP